MATRTFTITQTLSTGAYASGDVLGALVKITDVGTTAGQGCTVNSIVVVDGASQSISLEAWFFSAAVTPAADNAAHSLSDADAAYCVGVVPVASYYGTALNSIGVARSVGLTFGAGKDVWVLLVTRGAPTYAPTSLSVLVSAIVD